MCSVKLKPSIRIREKYTTAPYKLLLKYNNATKPI
jgi:hypothetical protein